MPRVQEPVCGFHLTPTLYLSGIRFELRVASLLLELDACAVGGLQPFELPVEQPDSLFGDRDDV